MPHNNEECITCNTYDEFKLKLEMRMGIEDAFRSTVSELVELLVDEIGDQAFVDGLKAGYKDGYVDALQDVSNQASNTALKIIESMDECDCDACTCDESKELTNEEKLARRALWEDDK